MSTAILPFSGTYDIDRTHSSVHFAVTHIVSTFRASFDDVEGRLVGNDDGTTLEASTRAESLSIVDPPEFREHVVRGDDFFAAEAHPTISFRSARMGLEEDGTASVSGDLVLRGLTGQVGATGTFSPPTEDPFGRTRMGLELATTIDRRAWGMDWQMPLPNGGDALGWEVAIRASLELTKVQ